MRRHSAFMDGTRLNDTIRPGTTGNLFLDSLAPPTAAALLPLVLRVSLRKGQILAEPDVPVEMIYFPIRSVISTVNRMTDGTAVEVGIAGPEGFSSQALAFGDLTGTQTSIVQIPDSAYAMSAHAFIELVGNDIQLRNRARNYAHFVYAAAAQFAACNRLHPIIARYARWLLMADDRVRSDEFDLTQEYSAQMLGVRRAGVTVAAGELSDNGAIAYRRGHVSVLDRPRLEAISCECYGVVNAQLRRLMGYDIRRNPSPEMATTNHSVH